MKKSHEPWSEEKLKEVLSSGTQLDLQVQKNILLLKENQVLLFAAKKQSIPTIRASLFKILAKYKPGIVFVSPAMPAKKILGHVKENSMDAQKITIVDASGSQAKENEKTICVVDQSDLAELIEKIEGALKNSGNNSFFVFDSLTTLLIYNDEKSVERFFHSLYSKLLEYNLKTVFLAVKSSETENLVKTISGFCDGVVEV